MKTRVSLAILGLPFFIAGFFSVLIFQNAREPTESVTPNKPIASHEGAAPHPLITVVPRRTADPDTAYSNEEPQPVVTFVRRAPYEKLSDLIKQHRIGEAIALLEEFLKTATEDREAYFLLGTLYYQKDQLSEAILAWQKVLLADPNNEIVKANIARATREQEAQSGFTRAMTRHFTIKFEGAQNRYLYQTVLGILEEAYGTVGRALQFYPDEEIIVLLYTDQQFFDVTRAPGWTRGIFDGKIRLPTKGFEERLDQLRPILIHEYVHAVIHQMMDSGSGGRTPPIPLWFNEGMAEYFSRAEESDRVHHRVQAWIKRGGFIKLSALEGSFMGLDNLHAAIAYDESHSAVTYLVDEFGLWRLKRVIEEWVRSPSGGMKNAISNALLISYDQFQSRWEERLK